MKKIKINAFSLIGILMLIPLSTPAFSSEIKKIESLSGIEQAPEIGSKYNITFHGAPIVLSCELKSTVRTFSACHIPTNSGYLYLDITKDNFTGRNVSGRNVEFTGIKHGQLFFKLIE